MGGACIRVLPMFSGEQRGCVAVKVQLFRLESFWGSILSLEYLQGGSFSFCWRRNYIHVVFEYGNMHGHLRSGYALGVSHQGAIV